LTEEFLRAFNLDSSAPLLGVATKKADKSLPGGAPTVGAPTRPDAPIAHDPIFIADTSAGADLLGIAEALQPIAQLCSHADTQTPLMIALVGPAGSGKSFALTRLMATIKDPGATNAGGLSASRVAVVPLDWAQLTGDPASAIAAATFQALAHDYPTLVSEAAHAGADPAQAASMTAARHDEIQHKLDAEREARDDVDGRRARLSELVLYETPGSRIDAFARASRSQIEGKLRRFDLLAGDPVTNFKDLVRDFSGGGAGSRLTIALRAIWGYRGQRRLLLWALASFALAFCVAKLAGLTANGSLLGFSSISDSSVGWLAAHGDWLERLVAALILLGVLALFVNFWRALTFSATLFRGLRLLNVDLRERRRELDASSARLNQRVAVLSAQAEAAAKQAEAAAKRVNGAARAPLAGPSPLFASIQGSPAAAARAFMLELGRLMGAPPTGGAPQRLVLTLDNFDAMPADQALNLIEIAHAMLGASSIGVAAFNPTALAGDPANRDALRERFERLFQITFNVQGADTAEKARMVARLLTTGSAGHPSDVSGIAPISIAEPMSAAESTLLTALAPLACSTPRRAKRFINLYRLARTSAVSRPAVALMLAVTLSEDRRPLVEMERLLRQPDAELGEPKGPPALVDAVQATRAASKGRIANLDAMLAMSVAQRYRLAI
jgi:hypothetical protein